MECKTTFYGIEDPDEFVYNLVQEELNFTCAFIKFEPGDSSKTIVELYFKDELSLILFHLTYEHNYSK
jgi:hypothetical protein